MIDVDYYELQMTNSVIHSMNSVSKLLFLIFMIFFIIFANSSMDMFMINLFLLVIMSWSNVSYRITLRNIAIFGVFIFLVCFFISLLFLDLYLGLFWTLKVIDVIALLSLIGFVTSYVDLAVGVRFLLKPIRFIVNIDKVSLKMAGVLKFMSIMYSESNRIHISKRIRGVKFEKMGLIDKIDLILNELVMLFGFSLWRINKYSELICSNKYAIGEVKNKYRLNKWTKADTILLIIIVLMIFVVIFY